MGEVARPHDVVGPDRSTTMPTQSSSASDEMMQWRSKSSVADERSRRQPFEMVVEAPNQYGSQPVPDSRNATRSSGWRSSAPSSTKDAIAAICSIGCDSTWRPANPRTGRYRWSALKAEPFVHGHGQSEVRARGPQRVVVGVAEVASVQVVRPHHHADEIEIAHPLRLGDGEVDIGQWRDILPRHRDGWSRGEVREPSLTGGRSRAQDLGDPVVVRAAHGRGRVGRQTTAGTARTGRSRDRARPRRCLARPWPARTTRRRSRAGTDRPPARSRRMVRVAYPEEDRQEEGCRSTPRTRRAARQRARRRRGPGSRRQSCHILRAASPPSREAPRRS